MEDRMAKETILPRINVVDPVPSYDQMVATIKASGHRVVSRTILESPIVLLDKPPRTDPARNLLRKAFSFGAQVQRNGSFLPVLKGKNWDGINVTAQLVSPAFSTTIRVTISCLRNAQDVQYTAYADFPFANILRSRDGTWRPDTMQTRGGVRDIRWQFPDSSTCLLSFDFDASHLVNFNMATTPIRHKDFRATPSEKTLVSELQHHFTTPGRLVLKFSLDDKMQEQRSGSSLKDFRLGEFLMSLPCRPDYESFGLDPALIKDSTELPASLRLLPNIETDPKPTPVPGSLKTVPHHPYMRASGFPRVQNTMTLSPRTLIQKGHPWQEVLTTSAFLDPRCAEASLGYGALLEYKESVHALEALSRMTHHGKIIAVGDLILIAVKWAAKPKLGYTNEVLRVKENLEASAEIMVDTLDYLLKAKCRSIDNMYGIPDCNLLLMVQDRDRAYFKGAVTAELSPDAVTKVRLTILQKDIVLRLQLDTASKIYDNTQQDGTHGKYLPALMSNGLQTFAPVDFFAVESNADAAAPGDLISKFQKWIKSKTKTGKPLFNAEQRAFLNGILRLPANMALVSGPGGTGKTYLIRQLVHWLALNAPGHKAFIASQNNEVCDHIAVAVSEMFPDGLPDRAIPVMRTSASSHNGIRTFEDEEAKRARQGRPAPETFVAEDMVMFQALLKLQEKLTEHGRKLQNLTVDHFVEMIATDETEEPLEKSIRVYDEAGNLVEEQAPQDMLELFRKHLPKLRSTPLNATDPDTDEKLWSEDETREVVQSYGHIVVLVNSRVRILVGTVYTSAAKAYAAFGVGATKISYFLDEAPTVTELSSLIPVVKAAWRDLIGPMILLGDRAQLEPTVTGNMNPHHHQLKLSLYARMVDLGWRQYELCAQARMHPLISEPSNNIFYNGNLRPSLKNNAYPLPDGFHAVAQACFGLDGSRALSEQQMRLATIVVEPATVRISTESLSRANYETFFVGIDILTRLHDLLGDRMSEYVALVCPYKRQLKMYKTWVLEQQKEHGWTEQSSPSFLLTIDSSQGREMMFEILDFVVTDTNNVGFMSDARRVCVGVTRAKSIQWSIIGPMSVPPKSTTKFTTDIDDFKAPMRNKHTIYQYKSAVAGLDCQHIYPADRVRRPKLAEIAADLRVPKDEVSDD